MMPPDLAAVLRDLHIFDARPRPRGRMPVLGSEVWLAYCSCGWGSKVPAGSVVAASYDHQFHCATVRAGYRRWDR